jgi:hypothetical protein
MFCAGLASRRPSSLRPEFTAMQSSPVSKVQPSISMPSTDSGSQPSLFGPWPSTSTSRTIMLRQSTGWICQKGEPRKRTPSISTLSQS